MKEEKLLLHDSDDSLSLVPQSSHHHITLMHACMLNAPRTAEQAHYIAHCSISTGPVFIAEYILQRNVFEKSLLVRNVFNLPRQLS